MRSYEEILKAYQRERIDGPGYVISSFDEFESIFGTDCTELEGYKGLTRDAKMLAEELICNYISRWGLSSRENQKLASIKRDRAYGRRCFRLTLEDGQYSFLMDNGEIG